MAFGGHLKVAFDFSLMFFFFVFPFFFFIAGIRFLSYFRAFGGLLGLQHAGVAPPRFYLCAPSRCGPLFFFPVFFSFFSELLCYDFFRTGRASGIERAPQGLSMFLYFSAWSLVHTRNRCQFSPLSRSGFLDKSIVPWCGRVFGCPQIRGFSVFFSRAATNHPLHNAGRLMFFFRLCGHRFYLLNARRGGVCLAC